MATQKPKSRTAKQSTPQLTHFKFRWWMALILVGIIAVIGIVIVQFSHAGTQFDAGNPSYVNDSLCVNGKVTYNGHDCIRNGTSFKGF